MSPQVDLSNWPNRAQAAAQLGMSERSVDRLAEAKKLEYRQRERPGIRPERVYNPDQIAAMLPPPPSSLVRAKSQNETVPPAMSELAELPPLSWPAIMQYFESIAAELQQAQQPAAAPQRFVNVKAAAEITGLSQKCIRRMMRDGKLPFLTDHNAWLTSRDALESFDPFAPPAKKGAKK